MHNSQPVQVMNYALCIISPTTVSFLLLKTCHIERKLVSLPYKKLTYSCFGLTE